MPIFPEYENYDALGLAELVATKEISAKELLQAAIERVEARNPEVNAVIHKMYDQAYAAIDNGLPAGIFHGVPFLLKDLLADYAGAPLSSGSAYLKDWQPPKDSELVKRFKQSGLVIFGKTNVPELGLSSITEPDLFGATRNPWNLNYSAGGSSGGSAAAVASKMLPMAHGNDGGGSIRIPASYCGLFGFKPSRGRTAIGSEMLRMWENMVVEHVLTTSVRDSAAMLDVIDGPEGVFGVPLPKPSMTFLNSLNIPVGNLQIAVMEDPFFPADIHPQYNFALRKAINLCEDLGHKIEFVKFEMDSAEVARAYVTVIAGEISASLKRFSEVLARKPKSGELERATAAIANIGDHLSAADFAWAGGVLEKTAAKLNVFFKKFDVLMTTTMAAPPPLIGQLKPDFLENSMMELLSHIPFPPLLHKALDHAALRNFANYPYTPVFNVSGQPAMSVPLFIDENSLPIGIQFAAKIGEEKILLQLARQLEVAKPWKLPDFKISKSIVV